MNNSIGVALDITAHFFELCLFTDRLDDYLSIQLSLGVAVILEGEVQIRTYMRTLMVEVGCLGDFDTRVITERVSC